MDEIICENEGFELLHVRFNGDSYLVKAPPFKACIGDECAFLVHHGVVETIIPQHLAPDVLKITRSYSIPVFNAKKLVGTKWEADGNE